MRYQLHKRINYKNYRVIAYSGKVGSGMTLAAMMQLVKESKGKTPPSIVSNCTLRGIDYEPFELEKLLDYQGKLVFLDMGYMVFDYRRPSKANMLFEHWTKMLRKMDSRLVFTSPTLEYVDKAIREQVNANFFCEYVPELTLLVLRRRDPRKRNLIHVYPHPFVDKYFPNYNTFELPVNSRNSSISKNFAVSYGAYSTRIEEVILGERSND